MSIKSQETFSDREKLIRDNPKIYFNENYLSALEETLIWLTNKFFIKDIWLYKNYLSDLIIAIWLLKNSYFELEKMSNEKEELLKWKNQLNLELSTLYDETKKKTEEIISSWKIIEDEILWYKSRISELELLLEKANENSDLLTSAQLDLSAQNKWLRIKINTLEKEKENNIQKEVNKKLIEILPKKNKKYKKELLKNIEEKNNLILEKELLEKEKEYEKKEMKFRLEISNLKDTISLKKKF